MDNTAGPSAPQANPALLPQSESGAETPHPMGLYVPETIYSTSSTFGYTETLGVA